VPRPQILAHSQSHTPPCHPLRTHVQAQNARGRAHTHTHTLTSKHTHTHARSQANIRTQESTHTHAHTPTHPHTHAHTQPRAPDVAVHLHRHAPGVVLVVPRVHAHHLGQAVYVERVVPRQRAQPPQVGERVVAARGAARLRLRIDLGEEGLGAGRARACVSWREGGRWGWGRRGSGSAAGAPARPPTARQRALRHAASPRARLSPARRRGAACKRGS
jgi:hypothetical protein